jgi:hypothetical protein
MTIITAIFIAGCFASLAFSYMQIAASVQRALNARFRGHAWILVGFLALVWPVALPALAIRDLLVHEHSHALLMGKKAWRDTIWDQERENLRDEEAEAERIYAEWQSRVNHFYKLGEEAESTQDWILGRTVADNLEFLLETEPPRPAKVVQAAKKKPKKIEAKAAPEVTPRVPRVVSPPPEVESHDETPAGYCDLCATHREKSHFPHYRITGT